MKPGTTPVNTFTLPYELPSGTNYRVIYSQGEDYKEVILFERTTESCIIDGKTLIVNLTDKETLLFDDTPRHFQGKYEPYPIKIQIGIQTPSGHKDWSNIIVTTVERVLRGDGLI